MKGQSTIILISILCLVFTVVNVMSESCTVFPYCSDRGQCINDTCECDFPWTSADCTDILGPSVNLSDTGIMFGGMSVKVGFYLKDVDYFGVTRNFYQLNMSSMNLTSRTSNATYTESLFETTIQSSDPQPLVGNVKVAIRYYHQDTTVVSSQSAGYTYVIKNNTVSYVMSFSNYRQPTSTSSFRLHVFPFIEPTVPVDGGSTNSPITSYTVTTGQEYSFRSLNMKPFTQSSNGTTIQFRAINIGTSGNNDYFQFSPELVHYTPDSQIPVLFGFAKYSYMFAEDQNVTLSFDFNLIDNNNNNNGSTTSTTTTGGATTTAPSTSTTTTTDGDNPSSSTTIYPTIISTIALIMISSTIFL